MKILVLGAAGKTGREVIAQGLAGGHQVTAFVHREGSLAPRAGLKIITGDAQNTADIQTAVAGMDAVISTLGHTSATKSAAQTLATETLIKVLPANFKVVSLTGYGVPDPKDPPTPLTGRLLNKIIQLMPGDLYNDGRRHAEALRSSNLAWTVVRAPRLSMGPVTTRYELGYFELGAGAVVSRADVADAMLSCLMSTTWDHQMPMIRCK